MRPASSVLHGRKWAKSFYVSFENGVPRGIIYEDIDETHIGAEELKDVPELSLL